MSRVPIPQRMSQQPHLPLLHPARCVFSRLVRCFALRPRARTPRRESSLLNPREPEKPVQRMHARSGDCRTFPRRWHLPNFQWSQELFPRPSEISPRQRSSFQRSLFQRTLFQKPLSRRSRFQRSLRRMYSVPEDPVHLQPSLSPLPGLPQTETQPEWRLQKASGPDARSAHQTPDPIEPETERKPRHPLRRLSRAARWSARRNLPAPASATVCRRPRRMVLSESVPRSCPDLCTHNSKRGGEEVSGISSKAKVCCCQAFGAHTCLNPSSSFLLLDFLGVGG